MSKKSILGRIKKIFSWPHETYDKAINKIADSTHSKPNAVKHWAGNAGLVAAGALSYKLISGYFRKHRKN
jgi:hypothetical protein